MSNTVRFEPNAYPSLSAFADAAATEYAPRREHLEEFAKKLEQLFRHLLNASRIEFQMLTYRVKELQSYRDKAAKPSAQNPTLPKYDVPSVQIEDALGLRVIVYLLDDVPKVSKLVQSEFDVLSTEDKAEQLTRTKTFGYRSLHHILRLREPRRSLPEWARYADDKFELQIPTVLQHAWAAIEHPFYKPKPTEGIITDVSRRLLTISGVLELADREFSDLKKAYDQRQSEVAKKIDQQDTSGLDITNGSVDYLVRKEFGDDAIDPDVLAAAVHTLRMLPYKSITDVVDDIERARKTQAWKQFLNEYADPIVRLYGALVIARGPDAMRSILCDPKGRYSGWGPFIDKLSSSLG